MRSPALAVLLLVLACGWSAVPAAAQAKKPAKTLPRLYEHVGEWSVLQAKKGVRSAGDQFLWRSNLSWVVDGAPVGLLLARCMYIVPAQNYTLCNAEFIIAGYSISAQGPNCECVCFWRVRCRSPSSRFGAVDR